MVKPERGQQCVFDVFLIKPVGVNKNLGFERYQRGLNPQPPMKQDKALVP